MNTVKKILCVLSLLCVGSCYEEQEMPWMRLLEGTWRLNKWTSSPAYVYTFSDGTKGTYTNLLKLFVACRHDDEYVFHVSEASDGGRPYEGTYVYQEGELACGDEAIMESCTWFLSDITDDVLIYFELPGSEPGHYIFKKIYTLEKVSDETLVFSYETASGYTWTEEYVRK